LDFELYSSRQSMLFGIVELLFLNPVLLACSLMFTSGIPGKLAFLLKKYLFVIIKTLGENWKCA
jgi:hypothetical protein